MSCKIYERKPSWSALRDCSRSGRFPNTVQTFYWGASLLGTMLVGGESRWWSKKRACSVLRIRQARVWGGGCGGLKTFAKTIHQDNWPLQRDSKSDLLLLVFLNGSGF